VFFFDSSAVASWVVFRLNMVGANVRGPKNWIESQTQDSRTKVTRVAKGRQRISESSYLPQKLRIPLHMPSRPLL
jgi:hypothetical protein